MFYYSILFKSCLENKVSWIAANQSQSIEGARNCGLSPSLPRIKAPYSFLWILPSEFGYLAIHHSSDEHFESAQVFISCSLLATIGDDKCEFLKSWRLGLITFKVVKLLCPDDALGESRFLTSVQNQSWFNLAVYHLCVYAALWSGIEDEAGIVSAIFIHMIIR